MSDLVSHFRQQAGAAKTPADQAYPRLALASILWWNDDKEDAIAEFTKVADGSKAESELRLDLAELLEQQGERADALAVADAVHAIADTLRDWPPSPAKAEMQAGLARVDAEQAIDLVGSRR